ncbi:MAG: acyltransferase [Bacteroidetes bacterium]|nr:acyltransferase [Bacteroidota bacterium]
MKHPPVEQILLEKNTPLTSEDKKLFAYFGEGAKIAPPFRILNPHRIHIGDRTSIREGAFINAFLDNRNLMNYIDRKYISDFDEADYLHKGEIFLGNEIQIGRFLLMSCTNRIELENNVLFSERVFVGDNNHTFSHPAVPIMQQPNKQGTPLFIGTGTWVGIGAALLAGTKLGRNCVVGANSVVADEFPDHSVIGMEKAKLLFKRHE